MERIAFNDQDYLVRVTATEKLTNRAKLEKIAFEDESDLVRKAASNTLLKLK